MTRISGHSVHDPFAGVGIELGKIIIEVGEGAADFGVAVFNVAKWGIKEAAKKLAPRKIIQRTFKITKPSQKTINELKAVAARYRREHPGKPIKNMCDPYRLIRNELKAKKVLALATLEMIKRDAKETGMTLPENFIGNSVILQKDGTHLPNIEDPAVKEYVLSKICKVTTYSL